MGLYAASKYTVEGLSETLDHDVRNLGIRVVLIMNASQAANLIAAYAHDRNRASMTIKQGIEKAPDPTSVVDSIVDAAFNPRTMRRTPKGEATLLRILRRFMPAGPVDASLRKSFGLRR